jgi:glycosyltransferase involved in cell wall biosynthesis
MDHPQLTQAACEQDLSSAAAGIRSGRLSAPAAPIPEGVAAAQSHVVIIPSYNTGAKLLETVTVALAQWPSVWVVIDGSTDGSGVLLAAIGARYPGFKLINRVQNGGKGAAVLEGLRAAAAQGFGHALIMDADGQHPAAVIRDFMALSCRHPGTMILGQPVFDRSAPLERVWARHFANAVTRIETLSDIGDSLFGFRVYPLVKLLHIMEASRAMRGFDFDTEAVVRLSWGHVGAISVPVKVRYFAKDQGGISHFRYVRDNILLAGMHLRLLREGLFVKGKRYFF